MPQWGGSDSGVITVNSEGSAAKAELNRTGEPSAIYEIMLVEGQTFFKRSTCSETFSISGGGANVLRPYLFAKTKSLAGAKDPRYEGNLLYATLDGLGPVTIELDSKTARPKQIRGIERTRLDLDLRSLGYKA